MELTSPFARARDRKWRRMYIALRGTALFIHKPKRKPFFGKIDYVGDVTGLDYTPGEIVKCYTLQGAEVGIAADYRKRHFTIRLRAETDQVSSLPYQISILTRTQFIFCPKTLDQLLTWTEALGAAIDLSPSLDERSLPRYQTIPRRRRPRAAAAIINEQATIIRRQFPHLATDADLSRATTNLETITEGAPLSIVIPESRAAGETQRPRTPGQESITSASLRSVAATIAAEEASADAKPELVTVSEEVNQRYAKRCMAVLVADAPRQCDWIIARGRRWKVLWEKKVLVADNGEGEEGKEDAPPSYYDVFVRP